MIYTVSNALGATVHDIAANERIDHVLMVNTDTGAVVVCLSPRRLDSTGEVARETICFDSIHKIQGLELMPVMFHCYGRMSSRAVTN